MKQHSVRLTLTTDDLNLIEDALYGLIHHVDHEDDEAWDGTIAQRLEDRIADHRKRLEGQL